MKTTLQAVRKNISATLVPLATLALLAPASADDTAISQQGQAYRQAIEQEALQKDMASIQAELASMRQEMENLLPGDVATIDRAFKQIESLSRNEMEATIASLRAAGRSGDVKTQLESLATAYKNQTAALSQIKRISGDLSERGIRDDMIQKLDAILKRQAADMDEVARIAAANLPPANLPDALMKRHQVVAGNQVSVTDDVNICIREIASAAASLPDEARKFMAAANAIITQRQLSETAGNAVTLTRDGPFAQAIVAQGSVADTLATVIHSLSSDEQTLEQLRQMSADLGSMIDDQKRVADAMHAERRAIAYQLQMRQTDISDAATALRAEVQGLNTQAAGETQLGRDSMEKVVATAAQGNRADKTAIAPVQQYAVDELDAAKRDIDKQIASMELAMQKELSPNAGTNPANGIPTPGTDVATTDQGPQNTTAPGDTNAAGNPDSNGAPDANTAPGQGTGPAAPGLGDANTTGAGMQGPGTQGEENTQLTGTGQVAGGGTPGSLNYVTGFGRRDVGSVQVVTDLNSHDRAAVAQLSTEKPPREFAPDVQQYYKNLADGAGLQP